MKSMIAVFLAGMLVAVFTLGVEASMGEEAAGVKEVTLKVEGMYCKMCPITVGVALKKLDGVVDADVSYEDKEAKVKYENDKVTVDEMIKAVENAGNYRATPIDK